MFTGIIAAVGHVTAIKKNEKDMTISIDSGVLDLSDVKLGDSIANNGVCLTVTRLSSQGFDADVSNETIKRSGFANIKTGFAINLEKAMQIDDRLGGHIVSGHVDGVGEVTSITPLGNAVEYWIKAPDELAKYIAEKGSITIDGISLTTNEIDGACFKLTIIPHTIAQTNMANYNVGTQVNLEVDLISRYLERLMLGEKASQSIKKQDKSTMDLLTRSGFLG
ncbi:riboflavin synthase [Psychromonas antarctica]|jgi:riboflavin synthase|uniref:riboflavin synthase n=1 Tax=Psychromonas antarctica TaxID=67573 RepID=UPI001EE91D38|nr:riboflavin synthase [Psychromonas antarctica]MCG6202256.1 riboflavin synthase [Psychromonas antarctica]